MHQDRDPRVLIVGAGPAGLAAARALVERGIGDILVIDRDDAPGGLPRFCHHPGFGLEYARWPYSGPGFVRRLLAPLAGSGVRIECRTTLLALEDGPVAEIVGPGFGHRKMRPRAIILATGIRESNRGNLMIPGGRAEAGILTTGHLQQLVARGVPCPWRLKSAVIVGTEHVSFSAILTARKVGLRVRALVGGEDRIMSFAPVAHLARACGIAIIGSATVREIRTQRGAVTSLEIATPKGNRTLDTDAVVFTGNWIPETAALAGGPVLLDPRTGGPEVDQAMRTSAPGIFAAGNVLHGVESSGWCANEGRHAGMMVARLLNREIGAEQCGRPIDLAQDIAFLVPQRWDATLAASGGAKPPIALRVDKDLYDGRLIYRSGDRIVWSSKRRTFLRKRRIAAPPVSWSAGSPLRIEFIE
jgi:thioredoxin reductase